MGKQPMTIDEYEKMLRAQPCMISGLPCETLHHVIGGSVRERLGVRGTNKHSDWLQLPLTHDHHQGANGIHTMGVIEWEERFGTQSGMIDELCHRFNLDLWDLARKDRVAQKQRRQRKNLRTPGKIIPHDGVLK